MLISGRIHNGVVALEGDISLPEGMEVTVMAPAAPDAVGDVLSDAERHRVLDIMDRIAALPIEGSAEPFSGANHDKALYAKP
jgi:hypothetical protein